MEAYFWIALLILAISAGWALFLRLHRKENRGLLSPMNVCFAGVLVAGAVLFLPGYLAEEGEGCQEFIRSVALSFYSSIRLFGAEGDYEVLRTNLAEGDLTAWYLMLVSVLMVLAPVLSIGLVISVFSSIFAAVRYALSYFRDVYIFSELNDRAFALATDLKDRHPWASIVFTDVFEPEEGEPNELREKARSMGAMCFKKDVLSVKFTFHSKKKDIWFFAMAEDESKNVNQALRLVDMYGKRENTHLYVFATSTESEVLLASSQNLNMKVRRVDHIQSLVNRTLYDKGSRLFRDAVTQENGEKVISAVVVGLGKFGTAMTKSLSWYCQMDGYRVRITAFDQDKLALERFSALCPELMSPEYNGVYVDGEAQYCIDIRSDISVDTKCFADQIMALRDTSYVLVALGSDEMNIRTAVNLRMLFERCGIKPVIETLVYDTDKRKALNGLRNFKKQPYDIEFIGDIESFYTEEVIIDSELEEEALRRHKEWGSEAEFWGYEYNYRSSIALAIHARAKREQGIAGAVKPENALTKQEREALEKLEHRRWNAYMRSEGYICSGSLDPKSRNDLGKMHHDLVNYAALPDEEKRKDSRVASAV